MRNDLVKCNHRIEKTEEKCQCSHARFAYKGTFDNSFCQTCPIVNKTAEPTLAEKLARVAAATARHVANGLKAVTDKQREERISICHGCDLYNKVDQTCRNCGCFLPIKVNWDSERCPLGKW